MSFAPADIPAFLDVLLESGFHHPGAAASLAIRLTNALRRLNVPAAKEKLREFLAAMAQSQQDDLVIQLVADVCSHQLG